VRRVPIEVSPPERARWLAELAKAIDEAQKVAWRLGVLEGDDPEAKDLYERLEAARVEVEALRRAGFHGGRRHKGPEWTGFMPWRGK
jgi:hypothetical protein